MQSNGCSKDLQGATLYNDGNFSFFSDEFWAFKSLLDYIHKHIDMKWVVDLNDYNEQNAFIVNNEKLWAMHNDPISKMWIVVTWNFFQTLISKMKSKFSSKLLALFWILLNAHNLDVLWILGFQMNGFFF